MQLHRAQHRVGVLTIVYSMYQFINVSRTHVSTTEIRGNGDFSTELYAPTVDKESVHSL